MSQKFTFVGTSASRSRVTWTVEMEAEVCRLVASGVSAKDAFAQVAQANSLTLPPSYSKHAASLLWSLKKRITARCEKGDAATLAAFEGLVTPTEQ